MKRVTLALALAALTSGCGALDSMFQNHYSEHSPTETKILNRPWFDRDKPTDLKPVYCYKTLVEMECFDQALAGSERPAVWTYRSARPGAPGAPATR